MIDVRVREEHVFQLAGVKGEVRIVLVGFGPVSLHHATIEQDASAVHLDKMHRAGDLSGCALKRNIHAIGDVLDNIHWCEVVSIKVGAFYHKGEKIPNGKA